MQVHKNTERKEKRLNVNLEAFKDVEIRKNYLDKISKHLKNVEGQNVNIKWNKSMKCTYQRSNGTMYSESSK